MINQSLEESIGAASPDAESDVKQNIKTRKLNAKSFNFLWKRDTRESTLKKEEHQRKREDVIEVKIVERKLKNDSTSKMPFGFFKNIKKHMQIKNLMAYNSKHKIKDVEVSSPSYSANYNSIISQNDRPITFPQEVNKNEYRQNNAPTSSNISSNDKELSETDEDSLWDEYTTKEINDRTKCDLDFEKENMEPNDRININSDQEIVSIEYFDNNKEESQLSSSRTQCTPNLQTDSYRETAETSTNIIDTINNEYRAKASLTEELFKLSKYGWYWGPISGVEADAKLISEPDGAFLVRDSSDDRYVLTLSFKSSGKLLHARMEHSGGLFSLCNQSESEGFTSVAALINHSMNFSQSAVFCYSRPKYPGYPAFPVRLTKPVSRFTQVRSLQYLCRFVIRQNTRLDNIHKLPLPKTIKGYIEEAHY